jgi:mono/diheme cytochrome c family protein
MNAPKIALVAGAVLATVVGGACAGDTTASDRQTLDRGRYLVKLGGCNDCHTPGYAEAAGQLPEREWLTGSPVGFQGPWGTTYPANLRLATQAMSEATWLERARIAMRPPMPWFALRDMSDDDLRAVYRYVRSLGARGQPAPAYAAPGQAVTTPYIVFVPQNLPQQQASK